MHVLRAVRRSPLGLDLYLWLTYRTFALDRPLRLTWSQLYRQFGADPARAKRCAHRGRLPHGLSPRAGEDSARVAEPQLSHRQGPARHRAVPPPHRAGAAQDSFSGRSPTCGPINGKTQQDLENVEEFCSRGIVDGTIEGAYAMGSLLWLKVTRPMAAEIRGADSRDVEKVVLMWMKGWKQLSGSESVTVSVEWQDVEIATGQTLLSGDKVALHR